MSANSYTSTSRQLMLLCCRQGETVSWNNTGQACCMVEADRTCCYTSQRAIEVGLRAADGDLGTRAPMNLEHRGWRATRHLRNRRGQHALPLPGGRAELRIAF